MLFSENMKIVLVMTNYAKNYASTIDKGLDEYCLRRRRSKPSEKSVWFRRVRGPAATQAKTNSIVGMLEKRVFTLVPS